MLAVAILTRQVSCKKGPKELQAASRTRDQETLPDETRRPVSSVPLLRVCVLL